MNGNEWEREVQRAMVRATGRSVLMSDMSVTRDQDGGVRVQFTFWVPAGGQEEDRRAASILTGVRRHRDSADKAMDELIAQKIVGCRNCAEESEILCVKHTEQVADLVPEDTDNWLLSLPWIRRLVKGMPA